MDNNMLEHMYRVRKKDMVYIVGLTDVDERDNIKMVNQMGIVITKRLKMQKR